MFFLPIIQGTDYQGYPLNPNVTYRQDILDRHLRITNETLRNHDNVLMLHFDLNLPRQAPPSENIQRVSRFNDKLNQYFKKQGLDPRYLWVREREQSADQPHYHYIVWLNGDIPQNIDNHIQRVNSLWAKRLGVPVDTRGLVNNCNVNRQGQPQSNGITLNRNAENYEANQQACRQQASHLAMTRGKGKSPGNRSFGSSEAIRK